MNIVILDAYSITLDKDFWQPVAELGTLTIYDNTSSDCLLERAEDADILLITETKLTTETINNLPKLKYIGVMATGYNGIDCQAANQRNIPVSNIVGYAKNSIAQHTISLLLELCRHPAKHDAFIKSLIWKDKNDWYYTLTPQIEVTDKTLGIIGFGHIGKRVAELAHAFGMNILVYSLGAQPEQKYAYVVYTDLDSLLKKSDFTSLHCPLTAENKHFINEEKLKLLPKGAFLINTARGQLVDEKAVAHALENKSLGGYATDVLSSEPPNLDNPILYAPNTIITPHIAWSSLTATKNLIQMTAKNIKAFLENKPQNIVNKIHS